MLLQEVLHAVPNGRPRRHLILGVVNARYGLIPDVLLGDAGEVSAPGAVRGVVEAGVVGLKVGAGVKSAVCYQVELRKVAREPVDVLFIENKRLRRVTLQLRE